MRVSGVAPNGSSIHIETVWPSASSCSVRRNMTSCPPPPKPKGGMTIAMWSGVALARPSDSGSSGATPSRRTRAHAA